MTTGTSDLMGSFGESPRVLRARIGRRARDARRTAKRSQADVASAAGVSVPTLQRFESGVNVGLDVLVRVAIALDADRSLRELFAPAEARTIDEILARRRPRRGGTA